ncbi:hypothetical protein MFRU_021g01220 [Monilinia fructicola]|nr:hypothetical protein MFRU_021g01220 [Monilinia fructicola]
MTPEVLNEVITLYIGKKRKKYVVHKKILCDQSKFFDAAFNGNFKEATKGEMYLPEDHPTAVAALIEYLYRGSLLTILLEDFGLYCLAEKIRMPSLMNKLIDLTSGRTTNGPIHLGLKMIKLIYEQTRTENKPRLLASILIIFRLRPRGNNENWMGEHSQILDSHPEFFFDVFKVMGKHGSAIWAGSNIAETFWKSLNLAIFMLMGEMKLFIPRSMH